MMKNSSRLFLGILLCSGLSVVFSGQARAEEPYVQFLNALRESRYFDMAEQYLAGLEQNAEVSAEFKMRLPYEHAVTLIQGATTIANYDVRGKQLDRAEQYIKEFVSKNAGHSLQVQANKQLGNLLQLRASGSVRLANSPGKSDRKAELLKAARAQYEESHKVFLESKETVKKQLEGMKAALDPKTQGKEIARRDELRKDYLQLQLLAAITLEETADTVDPADADYKKILTDAAKQFDDIYTKYRSLNAGVYSRVYQGRCYKKMGQFKDALGYFSEILQQPDNPAFRDVKTLTLVLAIECWLDKSQKKYSEAVQQGTEWVEDMRPNEMAQPDWLKMRLLLAEANLLYAEELAAKNPRDKQVRRSQIEARKLARDVVRFSGDYQEQARALLARLPGGDNTEMPEEEPENFAEAKDAAKEAIDGWQTSKLVLKVLPGRIQEETNAEVKQELQKQLAEAEEKVGTSLHRAVELYRLAISMVDDETPVGDVQTVYYYMAFCYYQLKEYYDAAMLGEFLARRYPDSTGATQGAKIALSAYHQLLLLKTDPRERAFENGRLSAVAQYMVENWPDAPETIDARIKLVPELLKSGNVSQAVVYVKALPEKHSSRADMELRIGREVWRQFRSQAKQLRTLQEESPGSDELATLKKQLTDNRELAAEYLNAGLGRLDETAQPSAALALSVLALSQYHVESGAPEKALLQIQKNKTGVLAIAQRPIAEGTALFGSETMFRRYAQDSHMLALRAYIGTLPTSETPDKNIQQAKAVMASLKTVVGSSAKGNETLVAIYYSLARDLESQLALSKTDAAKKTLAQGFQTFLNEVGSASNEFNVKNWVAETLYGLGKGFDTNAKTLTGEAKQYYGKSIKAYESIVSTAKSNPEFLHSDPAQQKRLLLSLKLRLAKTKRDLGDFEGSIDLFHEILVAKGTMLDVQIEAAHTYRLWGDDTKLSSTKRQQQYLKAISGSHLDEKTKRNTVWGWNQLGKITGRYLPKFQDQFYEARYNMAVCRYKYAFRKPPKSADRKKYMRFAKMEIMNTHQLYPSMGGKSWMTRYNSLLVKIQRELGEKTTGLPKKAT
jgi:hypothetical protein